MGAPGIVRLRSPAARDASMSIRLTIGSSVTIIARRPDRATSTIERAIRSSIPEVSEQRAGDFEDHVAHIELGRLVEHADDLLDAEPLLAEPREPAQLEDDQSGSRAMKRRHPGLLLFTFYVANRFAAVPPVTPQV